ncbi:MAG: SIS domain-containing protein [Patescibacteria group bacterium]
MEEQILNFVEQFKWKPELLRAERLPEKFSHIIVCGMGGSHLGAQLLLRHDPALPISVHSDYGLPREPKERLRDALIVASSYSGETEETLDSARSAVEDGLSVAIVTTGGALANFAEEYSLPLILVPKKKVEPRMAVGAFMLALAHLMRDTKLENKIREIGANIDVQKGRADGEALAKRLVGSTPLVYASTLNAPIAYFWKIAFNETGKVPAFYNIFPEVCHNELSGFDIYERTRVLSSNMSVIFLKDGDDHARINKRMRIMQELLAERSLTTINVEVFGNNGLEKALNGTLSGAWTALALAKEYGTPDAITPLISEFKSKMKEP